MDRGVWRAVVYEVTKSWTCLVTKHTHIIPDTKLELVH